MAKQNILIVDADPESVKVLEVSLKKVGYSVTTSRDGLSALELMSFSSPDLIISDTKIPELSGFEFCTKLKENEEWSKIPFIFLTADRSIENKIRGLELGVDDYLNKPIFIREILVRVNLAIQRRQKERLERRGNKSKFSGNLQDMGVVDLIQTVDLGHKSGVLHIMRLNDDGNIYFRDGQVIDATTRTRSGADAVYRMLVWSEGTFEIEFTNVDRPERIKMSTQGLLMEGMRRLDEWGRLQEQLPPLTSVFDVDEAVLTERLGEIPDEVNLVLKHFDGHASLIEVVDNGSLGDLEALTLISKLYFEGLITETNTALSMMDGILDPHALVPDTADAWVHSRPPIQHTPHKTIISSSPPETLTPTDLTSESETEAGSSKISDVDVVDNADYKNKEDSTDIGLVTRPAPPPSDLDVSENASALPNASADSNTDYFKGTAYREAVQNRPSYDPDSYRSSRAPSRFSTIGQDALSPYSARTSVLPIPVRNIGLMVIGFLVPAVLVGAAVYMWQESKFVQQRSKASENVSTIDTSKLPTETIDSNITKTKEEPKIEQKIDLKVDQPVEQSEDPKALEDDKNSISVNMGGIENKEENQNTEKQKDDNLLLSEELDSNTLTDEQKLRFDRLMKEAENVGRRRKISLYRQALEINPDSDTAMIELALQLMESKQTRLEARLFTEKAARINPDNAAVWLAMGYLFQLDDKPDEARAAYRKCILSKGPIEYIRECKQINR